MKILELAPLALVIGIVAASCSSSGDDNLGGSGGSGTGASSSGGKDGGKGGTGQTGGATSGGGMSNGGTTSGGGGNPAGGYGGTSSFDANGLDVVFNYDAPQPTQDACAKTTVKATKVTLAMYIMLDISGSMICNGPIVNGKCNQPSTKWTDAKTGLTSFVNDPGAAGIKVALGYLPTKMGQCDGTNFSTPAVPMGALPGNATPIVNSLNSTTPTGLTPTEGALNGLLKFTKSYATGNPTEKVVALLITDGAPTECDTSSTTLTGIASNMYKNAPSIPLYTMGMSGAYFTLLDALAQAGGTTKSFNVSSGGASAFLTALKAIQGSSLGCEFVMPTTSQGIIDPTKVQVLYNGSPTFPHVNDKSACGASGGWYYDNNTSPTKILLCDSTCTMVKATPSATIDIELGCLGS